jgi:hypothetical protein
LVGRCYLRDDLDWIKARNAVCPIATVMLYFDASQCSHSSHAAMEFNSFVSNFSVVVVLCRRLRLLTVPQWFIHFAADP